MPSDTAWSSRVRRIVIRQTGFMRPSVRFAARCIATQRIWKEEFPYMTHCHNRHFSWRGGLILLYDALPHNRLGEMRLCLWRIVTWLDFIVIQIPYSSSGLLSNDGKCLVCWGYDALPPCRLRLIRRKLGLLYDSLPHDGSGISSTVHMWRIATQWRDSGEK